MKEFVRFPRTPHLAWLGSGRPRTDKVLSGTEAREFLAGVVTVEEKLDGANIGISVDSRKAIRVQNRGSFLSWEHVHPQFRPLRQWLDVRHESLVEALIPGLILFGEWCYAKHTIHYTRLPDWFVPFDVYENASGRFWNAERRDHLASGLGLATVPRLARGTFDIEGIKRLLGLSRFAKGPAEGLYLRRERDGYLERRAKMVRAEFTETIGRHWTRAPFCPNRIEEPRPEGPCSAITGAPSR